MNTKEIINKAFYININNRYTITFVFKSINIFRKIITQFNNLNIKFFLFIIELIKFNVSFIYFIIKIKINSFIPFIKNI